MVEPYQNGYMFSSPLDENLIAQALRIKLRRASCILIDGAIGLGKTTLGVHIIDYINKLDNLPEASLKVANHPQIALGGKEFTNCFRKTMKLNLPVIVYDEAGDFNRRGAITSFNQTINRVFETYRGFKTMVVICLPNFNNLDNNLFDNQIPRMLIHITKRTANQGDYKVYSLSQMNWVRYWYDRLNKATRHKSYGMVIPNFYGHFKRLSNEREILLDRLSTHGKKEFLKDAEKQLRGLISYSELAQKLNRSDIWVRQKIAELKIKEKDIIDRAKYFDGSILDVLAELRDDKR